MGALNPLSLLIVVGSLADAVFIVAVCRKIYKNGKLNKPFEPVPANSNLSPKEISRRMIKSVSAGYFRMHILTDKKAPEFNDNAYLAKYRKHIRDPAVIAHIKSVNGGREYE